MYDLHRRVIAVSCSPAPEQSFIAAAFKKETHIYFKNFYKEIMLIKGDLEEGRKFIPMPLEFLFFFIFFVFSPCVRLCFDKCSSNHTTH